MANRKETSKFREMSKLTKFAFCLSAMSPLLLSWSIILCYQNRDYLTCGTLLLKNLKKHIFNTIKKGLFKMGM